MVNRILTHHLMEVVVDCKEGRSETEEHAEAIEHDKAA